MTAHQLHALTRPTIERTTATVLFVDVSDSMRLSRRLDLEAWWSVSTRLFELMSEGVLRFGGWVGNFTGDGIQAVFEPTMHSNGHAERACEAALWLRDAIRAPAAEVQSVCGLELSIRIGINSGEVVTGTIGHPHRGYHTANGYTVALAKRTESLAHPGGICVTKHTAALLTRAQSLRLRGLGAFDVKGADSPIEIYELLASSEPAVTVTRNPHTTRSGSSHIHPSQHAINHRRRTCSTFAIPD